MAWANRCPECGAYLDPGEVCDKHGVKGVAVMEDYRVRRRVPKVIYSKPIYRSKEERTESRAAVDRMFGSLFEENENV